MVRVDGVHVTVQLTGQGQLPMYAESEASFFLKIVEATLDFQQDASGGGAASAVRQASGSGQCARAAKIVVVVKGPCDHCSGRLRDLSDRSPRDAVMASAFMVALARCSRRAGARGTDPHGLSVSKRMVASNEVSRCGGRRACISLSIAFLPDEARLHARGDACRSVRRQKYAPRST